MSFSITNGALSYTVILNISSCQIVDTFKQASLFNIQI